MFSGGFYEHGNKPSGLIKDGELLTLRVTVPSILLMTGLGFVGIHTKVNLTFMKSPFVFRFIRLLYGITAKSLCLWFSYVKVTY